MFSSQSCNNGACNTCRYNGPNYGQANCPGGDYAVANGVVFTSYSPGGYTWYANGVAVCANTTACSPYTRSSLVYKCRLNFGIYGEYYDMEYYSICGPF